MLNEKDCVVINGFFPSLTMKHVLGVILNDILEFEGIVVRSCQLEDWAFQSGLNFQSDRNV
jgi:hypothetical protein